MSGAAGAGARRAGGGVGPAAGGGGGAIPGHVALLLSARCIASRERVFLALAERLVRLGSRVTVLAAGPTPELRAAVGPPLALHDIDLISRTGRCLGLRLPHATRMYLSAPAVAAYLRQARPDLLFATSIPPNLTALGGTLFSGQGNGTKVVIRQSNVVHVPGSSRYAGVRRRPRDWLIPRLYPRADAIIAVSAGVADNLRLVAPRILPAKIHTVPNGIALDHAERLAAEPMRHPWFDPDSGRPPVLLAVGRLVGKKDYPTLLRAFARVRARREVRLVILGDGPERAALERLAAGLGVRDAVDMPGFEGNPFAYMARADLFLLSSSSEGMASAPIEALACGCPVVSTDCPSGPAEVLSGWNDGALVPVGDAAALAEAILRALDRPPERDRLRARAAEFAAERVVEGYLAVLVGAGDRGA